MTATVGGPGRETVGPPVETNEGDNVNSENEAAKLREAAVIAEERDSGGVIGIALNLAADLAESEPTSVRDRIEIRNALAVATALIRSKRLAGVQ